MPSTRPGGRTVPSRKPIGGRVPLAELKRTAVTAFRLGQRIAEQRLNGDNAFQLGYEQGQIDAQWGLFPFDDPE